MASVKVPVRFLIGGNDGLTTPAKLGAWVDGIGRDDVTAMALEGADRAWQTSRPALARRHRRIPRCDDVSPLTRNAAVPTILT